MESGELPIFAGEVAAARNDPPGLLALSDGRAEGSVADMGMTTPGLVGRAEEIETMRDAAAVVGPGNARLCWWTAERIGKSRLVPQIITRLRETGELVLVGHGVEHSGDELPYGMAFFRQPRGVQLIRGT